MARGTFDRVAPLRYTIHMGMFDTVNVKVDLPVPDGLNREGFNWKDSDFQTKDLDNSLALYEITTSGRLMRLDQDNVWVPDDDAFLGGHFDVKSEEWRDAHYHGNLLFYTSYCEKPEYRWEYEKGADQMSWSDILELDGYDWWVEFEAVFDSGQLREIKLSKAEKTPIRIRLGSSKEWAVKRETEAHKFPLKLVQQLKKIPGWKTVTRGSSRIEQKIHEKVSRFLLKIS